MNIRFQYNDAVILNNDNLFKIIRRKYCDETFNFTHVDYGVLSQNIHKYHENDSIIRKLKKIRKRS